MTRRIALLLLTLFLTCSARPLAAAEPDLTPAIESALRATGVPALTCVVVRGDKVVYAHAFGLRDVEQKLPATLDTRFYIASATKSFTALTAALLDADKKLDLDAPLDTQLPELKLPPPLDPARLSLRDLLTHRLGFSAIGPVFRTAYSGEWDDATFWQTLAQFAKPRPRKFEYDNLGYVLAGYAIARASGTTWQDAMQQRVFAPLGMTATTAHMPIAGAPVALPYVTRDGVWQRTEGKAAQTLHAAGGVYTTANDLARWIAVNLGDGSLGGRQVFPRRVLREVHAPQIHLDRRFHRYDRFAYGLGWYLADYDGDLLVHHFGGFAGAQSHLSFLPERNLGVAVVTNSDSRLAHVVASFLYDSLLAKPEAAQRFRDDVQAIVSETANEAKTTRERLEKLAARVPPAVLAADAARTVASLAGTYASVELGTFAVDANGNGRFGELRGTIEPLRGNAFVLRTGSDVDLLWLKNEKTLVWRGFELIRP